MKELFFDKITNNEWPQNLRITNHYHLYFRWPQNTPFDFESVRQLHFPTPEKYDQMVAYHGHNIDNYPLGFRYDVGIKYPTCTVTYTFELFKKRLFENT